ncbi:MAG: hypothetical protein ACWA6R_09025 [Nitrosomonas sp.]
MLVMESKSKEKITYFIDTKLNREDEIKRKAISASDILDKMEEGKVILI